MGKLRLRVILFVPISMMLLVIVFSMPVFAEEEWHITSTIQSPDPQYNAEFGCHVDMSGDIIVVSESGASVEGKPQAGRVHVFDIRGNHLATLQSPVPQTFAEFGYRLAVSKNSIMITEFDTNKTYVFDSDGNLLKTIEIPESEEDMIFCLDIRDDVIAVGASPHSGEGEGKVHLYDEEGNILTTLRNPEPQNDPFFHSFGKTVALGEDFIIVNEDYSIVEPVGSAGRVYIFNYNGNFVTALQSPEPFLMGHFGVFLAISGDHIVIGEPDFGKRMGVIRNGTGRVYIYDAEWNLVNILRSPDSEAQTPFGGLDANEDIIVVGEPCAEADGRNKSGKAYVFDYDGNILSTLQSPDPQEKAEFGGSTTGGYSVAVSEDVIIIGEHYATVDEVVRAGRAHIFQKGTVSFSLNDITISPSSVKEGGIVTVTVDCSNTGTLSASYTVNLKIDDQFVDEKIVKLNPGETVLINFEVLAIHEGSYSVNVDGLTGSYTVSKPSVWERIPGFPYESIVLGLIAFLIILQLLLQNGSYNFHNDKKSFTSYLYLKLSKRNRSFYQRAHEK